MNEPSTIKIINGEPDDAFMIEAAKNVITMHKIGESEKINSLKFYSVLLTTIISIIIAIFKIGTAKPIDYYINSILLLFMYCVGTVLLRKLFAIRKNAITMSIELGSIYSFFRKKYSNVDGFINRKFISYNNDHPFINRKGSDYFNFLMILFLNTCTIVISICFFKAGLELSLKNNSQVVSYIGYILIPLAVIITIGNLILFIWFEKLTNAKDNDNRS